jgi:hypothetical protein
MMHGQQNVKTVFPVYAMKAHRRSSNIAPLILELRIRCGQLYAPVVFAPRKKNPVSSEQKAG